jgi:putative tryptophan/tyrosine transport system substrate-binding protein
MIRRRELIALLGGGAAAWPLGARAQPGSTRKIGFLGVSNPSAQTQWTAAFVRGLRELGWTEGQNLTIEYRWAEGRTERFPEIAAEFVRLNVDAIVTAGTAATLAAKRASSTIPVVFRDGGRSGRHRIGREPAEAGRQRHRPVQPGP